MAYPKGSLVKPLALSGQTNGKISTSLLENIPGSPTIRLLKDTSARAWRAMAAHALRDGILLTATSIYDSYRPYEIQERIFRERYSKTYIYGQPTKSWNGVRYWLRKGFATAAVPGHSNHGWAIALDVKNAKGAILEWLLNHAPTYGWYWELDSEPWHLRYVTGDKLPKAVLDYEAGPSIDVEDDDMIPGYDKSHEDVARATIRELCDRHWGKGKMSADEQTMLLTIWKNEGREKMMISLLDNAQNTT